MREYRLTPDEVTNISTQVGEMPGCRYVPDPGENGIGVDMGTLFVPDELAATVDAADRTKRVPVKPKSPEQKLADFLNANPDVAKMVSRPKR